MSLTRIITFAVLLAAGTAYAQAPDRMAMQGIPGMGNTGQALKEAPPLTPERVEGFIACMQAMRARYGGGAMRMDPAGTKSLLAEHGFEDAKAWRQTVMQVTVGYAAARMPTAQREQNRRDLAASRREILESDMPESRKQAMLRSMDSMAYMLDGEEEARVVRPYMDELAPLFEN